MTDSNEPDRLNSIDITIEGKEDLSIRPWNGPSPRKLSSIGGDCEGFSLESRIDLILNEEDLTVLPWRRIAANRTERQEQSATCQQQSERANAETRNGWFLSDVVEGVAVVAFFEKKIATEEDVLQVSAHLGKLVDEGHTRILLNFQDVEYISSRMIGILLSLRRRLTSLNGKLKLCCIEPKLLEVFRTGRVDQVFEIHATEQSALGST